MPVVVTGAAGFIGGMLVSVLAADGEHVVAVDRRPQPVCHPNVTAVRADLLDRNPAVESALREADAVYHLAGWSGRPEDDQQAALRWYRDNVLATRVVLAAVPSRTPLVVTSAASVYGGAARPSREDDQVNPLGGHARSKVEVERLCAERFVAGGAVSVARPFTVVGEGQPPAMAVARWIEAVRTGAPVGLVGSPWRTRDVTDVRDVVRSLRGMAERGVVGLLNVGTGAPRTLADLVTAVCQAVGAPPELELRPDRPDEPASTHADTRRHEQLLGFRPRTDLDDLVRRQLAAGLVSERLAIARDAGTRPAGTETASPPRVEPVFLETVLVDGERDRATLAEAVLGPPEPDELADSPAEDIVDDLGAEYGGDFGETGMTEFGPHPALAYGHGIDTETGTGHDARHDSDGHHQAAATGPDHGAHHAAEENTDPSGLGRHHDGDRVADRVTDRVGHHDRHHGGAHDHGFPTGHPTGPVDPATHHGDGYHGWYGAEPADGGQGPGDAGPGPTDTPPSEAPGGSRYEPSATAYALP